MTVTTKLLNKLYVNAFYKKNAGLFFFLVVTFLFSLIYINALDKIPNEIKLYWNLVVAIKLFSNPYIATFIFMLAIFYISKAYLFFTKLIEDDAYYFLFQTIGACSKLKSWKIFSYPTFKLFLPLYAYGLFGLLIGYVFHFWKIPALFITFNLIANFLFIVRLSYILTNDKVDRSVVYRVNLPISTKHLFEISSLNYVLSSQKLATILTKAISLVCIINIFKDDNWGKSGVGLSLVALFVSLAHAGILYNLYKFKMEYLAFYANIPISFGRFYLQILIPILLFLLPEWLVIFQNTKLFEALRSIFIISSLSLLFWGLLEQTGMNLKKYFKLIFLLGFLCYFLFLYGLAFVICVFILLYTSFYAHQQYHLKEI
ncbi:hypothetical protein [Rhizosphaericola mali]|uniref:Uncharacterized protein n=1 Tax=Rhizosphaericola mali TaxID=2545455 RepID=A0A5P2GF24_9BACT|nr:hypothetical protein [Rhizosphaericola mali]QES90211.1 hypothetical protein E0W69_016655 [Rhizosphaericola mali]